MKPLLIVLAAAAVFGILFKTGWDRRNRTSALAAVEQKAESEIVVTTARVSQSPPLRHIELPGSAQGILETSIHARAEGYIHKLHVDIGDRVKAGQLLVEIDSPELDQQLRVARARVSQLQAAYAQAEAALLQAQANQRLAQLTLDRVRNLVAQGILSRQEGDDKQAIHDARTADVAAAGAAIRAAGESIHAQEAEVRRIEELHSFKRVVAPYDGIITRRTCALGDLITPAQVAAGRDLYRIAEISVMRVYVDVPQASVPDIYPGQPAEVAAADIEGKKFTGAVDRTANALDAATRILRAEVRVRNPRGELMPGMYTTVTLAVKRPRTKLLIPSDTLAVRGGRQQVAVVQDGGRIHFQNVALGRDYGQAIEVDEGLTGTEMLVVNPSDLVVEGARVKVAPGKKAGP
ncbi:MAG: efflux RND transporter periplasmic adaptor subunit [Acidobacteria bacterium]|nr:efflux RND transporter periplasmic adaptor subunit [Acidobacteriota bacterium]